MLLVRPSQYFLEDDVEGHEGGDEDVMTVGQHIRRITFPADVTMPLCVNCLSFLSNAMLIQW